MQAKRIIRLNTRLSDAAIKALSDDRYPLTCGYCQMYARLVVQSVYGSQVDKWLWKPSAHLAAKAFEKSPYAVDPSRGGLVGDLYYWFATRSNEFGHVGIRVMGNLLAENSYRHSGGSNGCKGLSQIHLVRAPDLSVRLPVL